MDIKKVGVVGCGVMGSGISQVCAQSDHQVRVLEINGDLLKQGLASIEKRLAVNVSKGKLSEQDKHYILERIKGTTDIKDFSDCDFVIEALTENMSMKKEVFSKLDTICPKHTILSTNTSVLSIIDLAMATARPTKVLGLHFFNPPPVMKLLEIVKTIATSGETLEISKVFGKSLGKITVIAQDNPGFIVNRLMTPFVLNAIRMLEASIATREDIDNAINLGMNHPMGPLKLLDLIGIDTVFHAANAMYEELKDPQFAPPPLMKKMVTAGWLGRKTGKGFYEYFES
jgi:3-hydroxybutyryl-CoA dehydrogenase